MSIILPLLVTLIAFFTAFKGVENIDDRNRNTVRLIAGAIGVLSAALTLWQGISRLLVIVPAGNVGVKEQFGNVSDRPLSPGIHLLNPLAEVVEFSTRLQDIKETVTTTTQEGLTIEMDVSLQYKLRPENADDVYRDIGSDPSEIIISRFRSTVRETTASYKASAIYGEKRQEVTQRLQAKLQEQLAPLGFVVESTLLRNVTLPEKLRESIEAKLAAEQESQQAQFELEKTRQEAERQRVEARGRADAQRLLSEGLTEEVLQLKAIEATAELAQSQNTKVIIIGGGESGLPLILPETP